MVDAGKGTGKLESTERPGMPDEVLMFFMKQGSRKSPAPTNMPAADASYYSLSKPTFVFLRGPSSWMIAKCSA